MQFPADFRFGLATSAYQIEGAVAEGGRGPSIWDTFCRQPGRIDDGSTGEMACDHYHRWAADLDLLAQVGVQSYRFSVAWPRIFPTGRGAVNRTGLDFYQRLVDGLRQRGIAAVATLYHWDLPQPLQDRGGWENRDCAGWFGDYAQRMFASLDGVDTWLTINEAKIITQQGYQLGWMAPGKRDDAAAGKVVHHLGLAHGRAVQAYRASNQSGQIGPCAVVTPCYPAEDSAPARRATHRVDIAENRLYLDPVLTGRYPPLKGAISDKMARALQQATRAGDLGIISEPVDVVGVNYYTPAVVDASGQTVERYPVSPAGWQQIYPAGLRDVLVDLDRRYRLPLLVAENGVPDPTGADDDDQARINFLSAHLRAVHQAIDAGVDVRSFHAWSLLDNFEWARGYTQQWGLVAVDRNTMERSPKRSADWYGHVATTRSLSQ